MVINQLGLLFQDDVLDVSDSLDASAAEGKAEERRCSRGHSEQAGRLAAR